MLVVYFELEKKITSTNVDNLDPSRNSKEYPGWNPDPSFKILKCTVRYNEFLVVIELRDNFI
jgi:hypothetical protein